LDIIFATIEVEKIRHEGHSANIVGCC